MRLRLLPPPPPARGGHGPSVVQSSAPPALAARSRSRPLGGAGSSPPSWRKPSSLKPPSRCPGWH
eukprot:1053473-Alexandrium_andersonii.AAC.1